MEEFNNLIENIDVIEHPGKGMFYTWCNNRDKEVRTYTKIDRIFVAKEWMSLFEVVKVDFLGPGIWDYSSINVLMKKDMKFRQKPFRFHSF